MHLIVHKAYLFFKCLSFLLKIMSLLQVDLKSGKKSLKKILKEIETIENLVILVCFSTEWSKSLTAMELSDL